MYIHKGEPNSDCTTYIYSKECHDYVFCNNVINLLTQCHAQPAANELRYSWLTDQSKGSESHYSSSVLRLRYVACNNNGEVHRETKNSVSHFAGNLYSDNSVSPCAR